MQHGQVAWGTRGPWSSQQDGIPCNDRCMKVQPCFHEETTPFLDHVIHNIPQVDSVRALVQLLQDVLADKSAEKEYGHWVRSRSREVLEIFGEICFFFTYTASYTVGTKD